MGTISVEQIADRHEAEFARLRAARPALSSRISRAENILVTHLSCPEAGIIRPRIRGGELVGHLAKGSGGAVYRVEPGTFSCSCPDYHRRGMGCKHAILCWVLGRTFRPTPSQQQSRRCADKPKIIRHDAASVVADDFEHVGEIAPRVLAGVGSEVVTPERTGSSYEERECARCFEGLTYDGQRGEWVACEACSGTGRAVVFIYPEKRRLGECAGCKGRFSGRELFPVDADNLTFFEGDLVCEACARSHGIL